MSAKDNMSPVVMFVFFCFAVVLSMFFIHPAFIAVSVFFSVLYSVLLNGEKGVRLCLFMICAVTVISAINPLFSDKSGTVLFVLFGVKEYCLEPLLYGLACAGMFMAVVMWFSCYNTVMTSDKFLSIFGDMIPSLSLVLNMVLRLIPNFSYKLKIIKGARQCIGKSGSDLHFKQKIKYSMSVLSVLTTWALEGSVITSCSMKSRGYGTAKRSVFSLYSFSAYDKWLLAIICSGGIIAFVTLISGVGFADYNYITELYQFKIKTILGIAEYALLLSLPSIVMIKENIKWRILRSKI